jgi:hypothetical protein
MAAPRVDRRLAAILVADVVGCSFLVPTRPSRAHGPSFWKEIVEPATASPRRCRRGMRGHHGLG